ncbi:UvrD-helicase domain-containing protein [uncultured Brevibacillus sp.]|uniref:UvrD-helicase domain-containing protein n=1 Tax=uncultured Brevibacillus sp. TaxID=169970 RepID=UPI002594094B|nr:UvrD-helicase domain-containing protein [uncultured Brevibacillus sp.]
MNSFIDKITGKDKLLEQINDLTKQLTKVDAERRKIWADLNRLNGEYKVIKDENSKLAKLYDDTKENYRKVSQGYNKIVRELEQLQVEYGTLFTNATYLNNEVKNLNVELKNTKGELETKHKELAFYESRFGPILELSATDNPVSITDWDCSFFEAIEKIKGNPFNENQVEAIRYDKEKHLQIIAGAGSGKTETICGKVAYLIQMKNVNPNRICMMTFTKKARAEMEKRVNEFLGVEKSKVNVSTFHGTFMSLFTQLKKQNPAYASIGIQGDDADQGELQYKKELNQLIYKYGLSKFDKWNDKTIIERISFWTNMGYSVEQMVEYVGKHFDSIDEKADKPISLRFKEMMEELYQIRKEKETVVYDDFLVNLFEALQQYPAAREFVQNRFDYIFIDEFQDVNPLQMETVKLICPPDAFSSKLVIVGDDDQSIYAFRGSDPAYIKNFSKTYDTKEIRLMKNYRSKPNIVNAGNWVITANNHDRIIKSMEPFHKNNGEALIVACPDTKEEAHWILSRAEDIGKIKPFEFKGKVEPINYTKSVILYRSKGQLQSMFQALDMRGIPYVSEKIEDIMGIFSIHDFHSVFRMWIELLTSQGNQLPLWRPILRNIFGHFYVTKNAMEYWFKNLEIVDFSGLVEDVTGLIKKEKRKTDKDVEPVKRYLTLLGDQKQGEQIKMKLLLKNFFDFIKKDSISEEERDWINKELDKYGSWSELLGFYERMKLRREKMKENLEKYHKGEYNALYFLTIHGSKGLAFENVFVIGCYDGGLPSNKSVELKEVDIQSCKEKAEPPTTVEEERRLMYVAVTRARERVYVIFPKKKQDKPVGRSKFLKELNLPIVNCEEISNKVLILK